MTPREADHPSQYVSDILNLNRRLNTVIRGDDFEAITRVLIQGHEQYFDLVFRRLSLDFRPQETPVVLWLLDIIQARLAALERLQHENSLNSGVDAAVRNPEIPAHGHRVRASRCTG